MCLKGLSRRQRADFQDLSLLQSRSQIPTLLRLAAPPCKILNMNILGYPMLTWLHGLRYYLGHGIPSTISNQRHINKIIMDIALLSYHGLPEQNTTMAVSSWIGEAINSRPRENKYRKNCLLHGNLTEVQFDYGKEVTIPGFIQTISGNKGTCIKIRIVDFGNLWSNRNRKEWRRWYRSDYPWAYNSWFFTHHLYSSYILAWPGLLCFTPHLICLSESWDVKISVRWQ